jgi:phage tail-like protein
MPLSVRHTDNRRHDPFRKFQFEVKFGQPPGSQGVPMPVDGKFRFAEVSGLRSETEVVEYKEGSIAYTRKIPGKTSFSNIVLSRGLDHEGQMAHWYTRVVETMSSSSEENIRLDVQINLFDRKHTEIVAQWVVREAWITSFETEDLSGDSSDVLVQRMELACEFQRQIMPLALVGAKTLSHAFGK